MDKRDFLKYSILGAGALAISGHNRFVLSKTLSSMNHIPPPSSGKWTKEAYHYKMTENGAECEQCPNNCFIRPGRTGSCKTRINQDGKLYTKAYGNPCAVHIDPVEKKPLYHFLPTTKAFSIATAGCTLSCLNCQNWEISQVGPEETQNQDLMPAKVVEQAIANNCKSIAYTYSEPVAFYEYVYDTSKIARSKGIKNLLISNGYINDQPLKELARYIDAANINLKSFSDDIYRRLNGGALDPILNTLKVLKAANVWLEITNLVVPTWTDDPEMIKKMCAWLVKNGFQDNVLHFLRFFPLYKLTQLPTTPVAILDKARDIAMKAGMKYVYIGNVPGTDAEDTFCPKCKKMLINRKGFAILENNIVKNSCKFCGERIAGVWQ